MSSTPSPSLAPQPHFVFLFARRLPLRYHRHLLLLFRLTFGYFRRLRPYHCWHLRRRQAAATKCAATSPFCFSFSAGNSHTSARPTQTTYIQHAACSVQHSTFNIQHSSHRSSCARTCNDGPLVHMTFFIWLFYNNHKQGS